MSVGSHQGKLWHYHNGSAARRKLSIRSAACFSVRLLPSLKVIGRFTVNQHGFGKEVHVDGLSDVVQSLLEAVHELVQAHDDDVADVGVVQVRAESAEQLSPSGS